MSYARTDCTALYLDPDTARRTQTDLEGEDAGACALTTSRVAEGAGLAIAVEGGSSETQELWDALLPILDGHQPTELCVVHYHDPTGSIDVYFRSGDEVSQYMTECGGRRDKTVFKAATVEDYYARLRKLHFEGRLSNPNQPNIGAVCARTLARLGHLKNSSELYRDVTAMRDFVEIVAAVFPNQVAEFSSGLSKDVTKQVELLTAAASAVPGWRLRNIRVSLEPRDDGSDEYPSNDVTIAFSNNGAPVEWTYRHRPYIHDHELTHKILNYVENELGGRLLLVRPGCVYLDDRTLLALLGALAPPDRILQMLENADYNGFIALYDRLGYWPFALAMERPGRTGVSPQQWMDAHSDSLAAQHWGDSN